MDDLGVLDAVPILTRLRRFLENPLEDIERLAVAGVTDRVDRHLKALLHRRRHQFLIEAVARSADAAMTGHVRVVVEHTRAA